MHREGTYASFFCPPHMRALSLSLYINIYTYIYRSYSMYICIHREGTYASFFSSSLSIRAHGRVQIVLKATYTSSLKPHAVVA